MRVRLVVTGKVQGVGFRHFVLHAARDSGLRGFVRNLRDGSVEVVASGERETVDRLLSLVKRGPAGAFVESVEVEELSDGDEEDGFTVRFAPVAQ